MMFPGLDNRRIHVDSIIKTRGDLIAVLAHEMVHQLQDELNLPLTHGRYFKRHAARILKYGITI